MPVRLERERRVRKRPEFQRAQAAGKRVATRHFVFVISKNPAAERGARLGITASRRVGNAVRRNRLKRLVREVFRRTEAFVPAGFDVIVICRQDEPDLSADQVEREWRSERSRIERAVQALLRSPAPAPASSQSSDTTRNER